ncbi:T9SS type B sorting domain-containing protein, partial [Flavobacterium sp.]|uniref:T9SS type B sorting domain-containing protein n=1 Tax=Flavobacterium sp. TaxID=239 RepID=UPI0025BAC97F
TITITGTPTSAFSYTISTTGGCGTVTLNGSVSLTPYPGQPIPLIDSTICSGDTTNLMIGISPFTSSTTLNWQVITAVNVTGANSGSGIAPQPINDILTSTLGGYVIYRITSTLGNCTSLYTDYRINVNPEPTPILKSGTICVSPSGSTLQTITLDTGLNDSDYNFLWYDSNGNLIPGATNATLEVNQIGTYSVIAIDAITGCTSDPTLTTSTATITQTIPASSLTVIQSDYFSENATITANVLNGTRTLQYYLDEGPIQSSNVFTNVSSGTHIISVIDTDGCTFLQKEFLVIDYPKFFTPNGDGYNDTWNISTLNQPDAKLYIFDRYGKLIKQLSPTINSNGWDGTYNEKAMPSTDYWFLLEYQENGVAKEFKAHFSLKR